MAIAEDMQFLQRAHAAGCVRGSCLEIGSFHVAGTPASDVARTLRAWGLDYVGADIAPGPGVDVVVDFTDPARVATLLAGRQFDTIIMFNVIEHVFDPLLLLDTATALLRPGGALLISSPIVWELHRFPRDYWRPSPDFYEDYAGRRGVRLEATLSFYGFHNRLVRVAAFDDASGEHRLPSLATARVGHGALRALWSRAIHRLFNTLGRNHPYTWTALTCALVRDADSAVLRPTRAQ